MPNISSFLYYCYMYLIQICLQNYTLELFRDFADNDF